MKEKLDSESRAAIVKYRLERAYETLKEADYNTAGGYYNAAVNRLYYACYYAASALLLNCEIEANTHNGVKTQLSMHFVRAGHLSLDHGATFSLLFEKRQASDYSDFAYCDLALVNTLRPRAEAFINAMEQLINKECDVSCLLSDRIHHLMCLPQLRNFQLPEHCIQYRFRNHKFPFTILFPPYRIRLFDINNLHFSPVSEE